MGEVVWREIVALASSLFGGEGDELREVALVGADGVSRRVLVEEHVLQELTELFLHTWL